MITFRFPACLLARKYVNVYFHPLYFALWSQREYGHATKHIGPEQAWTRYLQLFQSHQRFYSDIHVLRRSWKSNRNSTAYRKGIKEARACIVIGKDLGADEPMYDYWYRLRTSTLQPTNVVAAQEKASSELKKRKKTEYKKTAKAKKKAKTDASGTGLSAFGVRKPGNELSTNRSRRKRVSLIQDVIDKAVSDVAILAGTETDVDIRYEDLMEFISPAKNGMPMPCFLYQT